MAHPRNAVVNPTMMQMPLSLDPVLELRETFADWSPPQSAAGRA